MSQPRRCGEACQWRPRLIALAITAGLGLSTVSSLDCRLVALGDGGYGRLPSGIGLWSLSGPDGRCLSYQDARERAPSSALGGTDADDDFIMADGGGSTTATEEPNNYSMWLMNGDMSWSLCRMMAIAGAAFGFLATVSDVIESPRDELRAAPSSQWVLTVLILGSSLFAGLDNSTPTLQIGVDMVERILPPV